MLIIADLTRIFCYTKVSAVLRFIPAGDEVTIDANKVHVEIPALFAVALEIGSKTGVKTLNTLHLASAAIAARIYGEKLIVS